MKFTTLVALIGHTEATKVMSKASVDMSLFGAEEAAPVELAEADEAAALELADVDDTAAPVQLAQTTADAGDVADFDNKQYQYPVQEQNFNGILGMLGTPTSMTDALHMQMNQIHFNERVMRQIRAVVEDTPELIETLCAADGEDCKCVNHSIHDKGTTPNIIYGAITDEGKIDYMLGFAQDLADPSGTTKCSKDLFGDPVPDMDKYCWCQTWESDHVEGGHHEKALEAAKNYKLQTIPKGNAFSGLSEKKKDDKAYCRCHTEDKSEGISICNTGCGNPNKVCNDDFGCSRAERKCNSNKCTCKPDGIDSNTMTYQECHDQCEALDMVPISGAEGVAAAVNTGCNINGLETWVMREEL